MLEVEATASKQKHRGADDDESEKGSYAHELSQHEVRLPV